MVSSVDCIGATNAMHINIIELKLFKVRELLRLTENGKIAEGGFLKCKQNYHIYVPEKSPKNLNLTTQGRPC